MPTTRAPPGTQLSSIVATRDGRRSVHATERPPILCLSARRFAGSMLPYEV